MKGKIVIDIKSDNDDAYRFAQRLEKYEKIFRLLIDKGALDGVTRGSSNIHFGNDGEFTGIELSYWPWRERRN